MSPLAARSHQAEAKGPEPLILKPLRSFSRRLAAKFSTDPK
jgi:hypothetical protein